MKKRWLSLYVDNDVGILARISGLFAGKNYNLDSLTVGTTRDTTVSRMTISLTGSDALFEQIKKQLNRCVGIIKVIDLTTSDIEIKELLFIRISGCTAEEISEITVIADKSGARLRHCNQQDILLELSASCDIIDTLIASLNEYDNIEIVRSGAVAIEY
ncbi:MAG: acetolactate synthase small subunit [Lachnospiraceae bacterium]